MRNEDILSAAQKDKSRGKEYENKASIKSGLFGSFVGLLVGALIFILEYFIKNSVNIGLIAVGMAAYGSQSLFEGIKIKKAYLIVAGVIQLLIAVFAILIFICKLVTK